VEAAAEHPVQPTPLARVGAGRESPRVSPGAARSDLRRLPAGRLTGPRIGYAFMRWLSRLRCAA